VLLSGCVVIVSGARLLKEGLQFVFAEGSGEPLVLFQL
jgi:hypothetical protein